MDLPRRTLITVEADVEQPVDKVWECWTMPEHITQWNYALEEWHSPHATNDLRAGGKFSSRMEAKDGSVGFDFAGEYDIVDEFEYIEYTLGDSRKVKVHFTPDGNHTKVVESFEAEDTNSIELQRTGWQAILDNFKKYAESRP